MTEILIHLIRFLSSSLMSYGMIIPTLLSWMKMANSLIHFNFLKLFRSDSVWFLQIRLEPGFINRMKYTNLLCILPCLLLLVHFLSSQFIFSTLDFFYQFLHFIISLKIWRLSYKLTTLCYHVSPRYIHLWRIIQHLWIMSKPMISKLESFLEWASLCGKPSLTILIVGMIVLLWEVTPYSQYLLMLLTMIPVLSRIVVALLCSQSL
jgi:hypothetical protein